jgi:hypothetical protein
MLRLQDSGPPERRSTPLQLLDETGTVQLHGGKLAAGEVEPPSPPFFAWLEAEPEPNGESYVNSSEQNHQTPSRGVLRTRQQRVNESRSGGGWVFPKKKAGP